MSLKITGVMGGCPDIADTPDLFGQCPTICLANNAQYMVRWALCFVWVDPWWFSWSWLHIGHSITSYTHTQSSLPLWTGDGEPAKIAWSCVAACVSALESHPWHNALTLITVFFCSLLAQVLQTMNALHVTLVDPSDLSCWTILVTTLSQQLF